MGSWSVYSSSRLPKVSGCPCDGYRRPTASRPTPSLDHGWPRSSVFGHRRSNGCRRSLGKSTSSENAQEGLIIRTGEKRRLPFFSRYHCEGSARVGVFRQNVEVTPGGNARAFAYCFPSPGMVVHVIQHMAECEAHAVIALSGVRAYWFPQVSRTTVRALVLPPKLRLPPSPGRSSRLRVRVARHACSGGRLPTRVT